MPRIPLALPPGSGRRATPQETRQAWWDMSLVRWVGNELMPIGGWKQLPGIALAGVPCALLAWRDNAMRRWVAAAALGQVQVWDGQGGTVLSPLDFVVGAAAGIADGYGVGDYGMEPYGVHRSLEPEQFVAAPGDSVSLDNWGEDLLFMGSADGRLFQWTPNLPVVNGPVVVANAPRGRGVIVTEERHIVVFGADGDPRRVSWCSQELPTDWATTATNTAGSLQLRSTGSAVAARRVAEGVLIFCDDDVHLLRYVGTPYIYGLQRVGSGCGPAGPQAMVAASGRCIWWSAHTFWKWDGGLAPLDCPLAEFLDEDVNPVYRGMTYGWHNGLFPEITWGYCSPAHSTPDSYITWHYGRDQWWTGKWDRTAGCEPGAFGLPLLGRTDGLIFQHETGWLDDGNPRGALVYAETGDLQDGEGDTGLFLEGLAPDLKFPEMVCFQLLGQWEPEGPEDDFGVYQLTRPDGLIDCCLETRSLRFRIEGVGDGPWALGRVRLLARPGAGR
jgi:hypothetical protein